MIASGVGRTRQRAGLGWRGRTALLFGVLGLSITVTLSSPEARIAVVQPPQAAIGVFLEPGFPASDADVPDRATLARGLEGLDVVFLDAVALPGWLDAAGPAHVLVMPYGSAFPREAWPAVARFLQRGGCWVNLGGVPFATPVVRRGNAWSREPRSSSYYKTLGFTHVFEVPASAISTWQAADPAAVSSPLADGLAATSVFALDARLSNTRDFADEDGTTGQRDARLTPLLVGVNAGGTRLAAPFIRIDRLQGPFAGGAWLLAPIRGSVAPAAVRSLVEQARLGGLDFVARPVRAGYRPGETPLIELAVRRPRPCRAGDPSCVAPAADPTRCLVEVLEASGRAVMSGTAVLDGQGEWQTATFEVRAHDALPRGLYKVRATIDLAVSPSPPHRLRSATGFWIYDLSMLEGGTPLSVQGDGFTRGGLPFPVIGTTYMASDVHRKFLLEPNPYLWDRDFAAMKTAGVNLVRTGIWSGWKIYMPEVGALNETFLRSLDVFLLTARKHQIPVIFTLFAFLPEAWGGANPYLDPRSVSAQATFAALLARRYAKVQDLNWDLINEPSFSSAAHLWKTRPNYDAFESDAWQDWLISRRHRADGADADPAAARRQAALRAWDAPPDEDLSLPPVEWFTDRHLFGVTRPRKVLDYRLFAQSAFADWVGSLARALRSNGHAAQLVTVGQDEGGLTERPGPLFFGASVDFTCMHTWWNNDALAWDSVLSRRPDRPLLVEETGLMRYERMDGTSWRTEADAAHLLERKLAIAFGTGSAGAVQWIWNANPYMASDNEAGIGFFRADGTARPELRPFAEIAAFVAAHAGRFSSRRAEDVALVVPQSQVLSVRDYGTEATRRAVRALYYHLQVPVRAVGEYQIAETLGFPALIIAPSPIVLTGAAWQALLSAVARGATLLISGPLDRDEYWRPVERLRALGLEARIEAVAGAEEIDIGGHTVPAAYRGEKLERVEKAIVADRPAVALEKVRFGGGTILWSPLPLELAESIEPTVAFYRAGLAHARVAGPVAVSPSDPAVFVGANRFADSVLVALASEGSAERQLDVRLAGAPAPVRLTLPPQRAVLLLLDAKTGAEIARTTPRG